MKTLIERSAGGVIGSTNDVADADANVIYGIVNDETMGGAVKVTVIATGFTKHARKAPPTPVDLTNIVGANAAPTGALAEGQPPPGEFYRKTPNPKAAAAGGGGRLDLDVPAFIRKQGGSGPGND